MNEAERQTRAAHDVLGLPAVGTWVYDPGAHGAMSPYAPDSDDNAPDSDDNAVPTNRPMNGV